MSKAIALFKNREIETETGKTYADVAEQISKKNDFVVAKVDGELKDLSASITKEKFTIQFLNFDTPEGKDVYWHTSAHILAQAVKRLYPNSLFTIGPSIDKGFYYDFDMGDYAFQPDDAEKIEAEMKKIIAENLPISRKELSKKDALKLFNNNIYKTELINGLEENAVISTYTQGDFTDLCRGPHLPVTGMVKEIKIVSFAGAYWRGDSKNKMLQRIYAISFPSKKEIDAYFRFLEEAKKRDHRKIGKEMDLFSFHDEGPGFPFWHNKGTVLFNLLVEYMRKENLKRGYTEIKTPPILSDVLWKMSGHWDNFRNNMYFTDIDERTFAVKPMNCPGGLLVFNTRLHSYRELPIKQAEFGLVHRHELSGVLHGLFRVRSFTQDDAHVFCDTEQLPGQIEEIIEYTMNVYKVMGFNEFAIFIATRPEKSIGTDENWNIATESLKKSLEKLGIEYGIKEGEGAFYGPKIEFNIKDCLGRNWQCGTVQVDFSMPERFDISFEGSDGKKHRPIMVHRAILGSLERFIGILLEHYEGKLPVRFAPVQVKIISVNAVHIPYCNELLAKFTEAGVRAETDYREETLGYKIREARNQRIPFSIIIGDKEVSEKTIAVRNKENQTETKSAEQFIKELNSN